MAGCLKTGDYRCPLTRPKYSSARGVRGHCLILVAAFVRPYRNLIARHLPNPGHYLGRTIAYLALYVGGSALIMAATVEHSHQSAGYIYVRMTVPYSNNF